MPPMTDEQLLQIAANHVGKLDGADLSELDLITTERGELIAFGRAVEAETRFRNQIADLITLTSVGLDMAKMSATHVLALAEVETRFRAWIQQEHGLIPSQTATTYAAAFAMHMLRGEVK